MITIDEDLGINFCDEGPWRSYHFYTSGKTKAECMEDATISEIDQDGGELNCYGLEDCEHEVETSVMKRIDREFK